MTKRVQLFDLSPKAAEIRRNYLLSQKDSNYRTEVKQSVKVSPKVMPGGPRKTPKRPNQADPINRVVITPPGEYRYGDGDFPIAMRPGCDDHKKYKSLITPGTTTYARSHV